LNLQTVLLPSSQAFISVLVSVLVVFVLLVVNAALMAGAVGRKASFVFPWLATYAVVILASGERILGFLSYSSLRNSSFCLNTWTLPHFCP